MLTRLPATGSATAHAWRFSRISGLDQVRFETADDFLNLGSLDQKLWVALSCPTRGLEFDERTLALIDTDADGRVRAPELIAAVRWASHHLKDPGVLAAGGAALPLSAINDTHESGARLLAAARHVLAALDKSAASAVTADDTADLEKIFGLSGFSGDGVLGLRALGGEGALRQLVGDVTATIGAAHGRGGVAGVDAAGLVRFFDQLQAYAAWSTQAEKLSAPFGADAFNAWAALKAVKAKIADYFARCRLAAFDARATAPLNRAESEFVALAGQDLSKADDGVASLPLARVEAGRALPLVEGINPAWAAPLATFRTQVLEPLLGQGRTALTEAEWAAILEKLAPGEALAAAKPAGAVEGLGLPRIRALLASDDRARCESLMQHHRVLAQEMESLDRLVRYHRDLGRLVNNFVSFSDFYSPGRWATFQAGTLYLDSRSCDLCVQIDDPGAHATLAAHSRIFLAYCDCRRAGAAAMKIAACFTQGDSDYLMVGRNGVFYDRRGRDWDATITKVVETPISLRQAFWLPYKKLVKFIEDQAAKFAAAKDKAASDQLATGTVNTAAAAAGGQPRRAEAFDIGKFAGIFAAIGLALGYIGGALSAIILGFVKLAPWQMPVALVGAMLLISGPSVLLTWLKLRQRTLGPVLDATGWAINSRVKINLPLGVALTQQRRLPANARRSLTDPYEDKDAACRRRWIIAVLALVALAAAAWWWRDQWWWRVTGGMPPVHQIAPPPAAPAPAQPAAATPAAAPAPATP